MCQGGSFITMAEVGSHRVRGFVKVGFGLLQKWSDTNTPHH